MFMASEKVRMITLAERSTTNCLNVGLLVSVSTKDAMSAAVWLIASTAFPLKSDMKVGLRAMKVFPVEVAKLGSALMLLASVPMR